MQTLDIGISQEELREQVVERAASKVANMVHEGEIGEPVRAIVRQTVEEVARRIADDEVRPWVEGNIESLVMQRTNEWGEAKGEPQTFREYVIAQVREYAEEPVSYDGKTRKEGGSFGSWKASGTRLGFMIDSHLQYRIKSAIEDALANANTIIVGGLEETVKIKLREVADALKVEVKKGR